MMHSQKRKVLLNNSMIIHPFFSLSLVDVFICGGYNGELILADLWKINLQTFQWSKLPAVMPEPAYFHCAAVTPVSITLSFPLILNQLFPILKG